jgi:hypothetical protein
MKVLSIDLDYIMGSSLLLYNSLFHDENPSVRWKKIFEFSDFSESHFYIDQSALLFCFDIFLKSLKNSKSFSFGYEHDDILHSISDYSNIELINVDHHDDVFMNNSFDLFGSNEKSMDYEYENIKKCNYVNEGNWIGWLASKGKLKSCVWITNPDSSHRGKSNIILKYIPKFYDIERHEITFQDYNFDHVFLCLSPQYVPKNHWHYFRMFLNAYEEFTGNQPVIITNKNKKFELEFRYTEVNDAILH